MKLRAFVLFSLALAPAFAMARPKPEEARPRTQTTHDRAPKIHQRDPQPRR
ncbi:MAG TPA: hypothetical protein VGG95_03470 [Edaphobacter sp.]|jgi:hypothetical protein